MSLKYSPMKLSQGDAMDSTSKTHIFLGNYRKDIVEYLLQKDDLMLNTLVHYTRRV